MSFYAPDCKISKLKIMNMAMVGTFAVSSDKLRSHKESALK